MGSLKQSLQCHLVWLTFDPEDESKLLSDDMSPHSLKGGGLTALHPSITFSVLEIFNGTTYMMREEYVGHKVHYSQAALFYNTH
jgi:hypothetical protein